MTQPDTTLSGSPVPTDPGRPVSTSGDVREPDVTGPGSAAGRRNWVRSLGAAVLAGVVVRVVYLFSKWNDPLLLNDSLYYSVQASQLADGIWFLEPFSDRPGAEHGPLTTIVLAPFSFADDAVPWQRLATVLTGIAAVVVIGLLGRRVGGERVGVLAAAIAAVYPNLWMNDGLVMSESISCLVLALALLCFVRWIDDGGVRDLVLAGGLLGLGSLARSEIVLALALLVLVVAWRSRADPRQALTRAATFAAAGAVVLAPWVGYNLTRFERPVLLTTNDGTTLLGSNCDETYRGGALGGWSLFCVLDDPGAVPDEEPSVRSARQRAQAIDHVSEHLTRLPVVVAARMGRTLDLYGLSNLVHQDVGEERPRWASWAGIVGFWCLAVCAAFGVRRCRPQVRVVLWVPVAVVVAATVLFYGGHRIRSSAEPVVVVAAAIAIAAWWERRRPSAPAVASSPTRPEAAVREHSDVSEESEER